VDISTSNSGYQAVYSAALKALETDPYQEVAFSVATSKLACMNLGAEVLPRMKLHLWNETLEILFFVRNIMENGTVINW
jgi:hypothetical protein